MKRFWMKKAVVLPVLMLTLLLVGCVNLQVDQEIKKDGTTEMNMVLDFSIVKGLSESLADSTEPATDYCANFSQPTWATEHECTSSNGVTRIKFSGNILGEGFEVRGGFPYNTYRFDLTKESLPEVDDQSEITPAQVAMIKQYGGAMEYTIKMPGKITTAPKGQITNKDTVKFDLLDIMASGSSTSTLYVESQELNWVLLLVVVGGLLFFIFVLMVALGVIGYKAVKSRRK